MILNLSDGCFFTMRCRWCIPSQNNDVIFLLGYHIWRHMVLTCPWLMMLIMFITQIKCYPIFLQLTLVSFSWLWIGTLRPCKYPTLHHFSPRFNTHLWFLNEPKYYDSYKIMTLQFLHFLHIYQLALEPFLFPFLWMCTLMVSSEEFLCFS